ncbi:hypothetical protein LXL04_036351 [Taraxacum kok-saghyz]
MLHPMSAPPQSMPSISFSISIKKASTLWIEGGFGFFSTRLSSPLRFMTVHKGSAVLQEVRILQSLDHSNVVKFYNSYEVSAHLWLILEYCGIGDLRTALEQYGKLPEDSVHDLACDLVSGLRDMLDFTEYTEEDDNAINSDDEYEHESQVLNEVKVVDALFHESDVLLQPVMPLPKQPSGSLLYGLLFIVVQPSNFVKLTEKELDTITKAMSGVSALRVQLASLIGVLICHSDFINEDLAKSGLLEALKQGLVDHKEKKEVRRMSMAVWFQHLLWLVENGGQVLSGKKVLAVIPRFLETVISDVRQLAQEGGGGSTSKTNLRLFRVLIFLLSSRVFKYKVGNAEILQQLEVLINLAASSESPFEGRDDFQRSVVCAFSMMTKDPSLIVKQTICKKNKDERVRYYCLNLCHNVVVCLSTKRSSHYQLTEDEHPNSYFAQIILKKLIDYII